MRPPVLDPGQKGNWASRARERRAGSRMRMMALGARRKPEGEGARWRCKTKTCNGDAAVVFETHSCLKRIRGERMPGSVFPGLDERHSRVVRGTRVGMGGSCWGIGPSGGGAPIWPLDEEYIEIHLCEESPVVCTPRDSSMCVFPPVTKPLRFNVNPVGSEAGVPGTLACRSLCRMFSPCRTERWWEKTSTGRCSRSWMGPGGPIVHC